MKVDQILKNTVYICQIYIRLSLDQSDFRVLLIFKYWVHSRLLIVSFLHLKKVLFNCRSVPKIALTS